MNRDDSPNEETQGRDRRKIGLLIGGVITAALVSYTWKDTSVHITQVDASCGEDRRLPNEPVAQVSAEVHGHDVDLQIEKYWFYCAPPLVIKGTILGSTITLNATSDTVTDTSCLCPYSARVRATGLKPGQYTARLNLNVRDREEFATTTFVIE